MGAMSGRGAGYCPGAGMKGYANPGPGAGPGLGVGRGSGLGGGSRGWRHRSCTTLTPGRVRFGGFAPASGQPDPEWEKQVLKSQADVLQAELDLIKKRLSEMEASTES